LEEDLCGKSTVNEDTTRIGACPLREVEHWRTWENHGSYLEKHPEEVGEDTTGAGAWPICEVENLPVEAPRRSR
jgi:hypothetical protein